MPAVITEIEFRDGRDAGAGVGVVTDSVVPESNAVKFIPLRTQRTEPLVLVWHEDDDPPAARRFRELLREWKSVGQLRG